MDPIFSDITDLELESYGYNSREELEQLAPAIVQFWGKPKLIKATDARVLAGVPEPKPLPTSFEPIEPKPVAIKAVAPIKTYPTLEDVRQVEAKVIAEAKQLPIKEGRVATDAETQAIVDYTKAISDKPRDVSGRQPFSLTQLLIAPALKAVGAEATAQALAPQTILSPAQKQAIEDADRRLTQIAEYDFINQYRERPDLQSKYTQSEYLQKASERTSGFKAYQPLDKKSYMGMDTVAQDLLNDSMSPDSKAKYDEWLASQANNTGSALLPYITQETDTGLKEGSVLASLRGLVLPESVALTGLESLSDLDFSNFDEKLAKHVAKGEGLEEGGRELAAALGINEDLGWYLGLAAGFVLPIDLGVTGLASTAVGRGVKGLAKLTKLDEASVLAREFGEEALTLAKKLEASAPTDNPITLTSALVQTAKESEVYKTVAKAIEQVGIEDLLRTGRDSDLEDIAKAIRDTDPNVSEALKASGLEAILDSKTSTSKEFVDWLGARVAEATAKGSDLTDTIGSALVKRKLGRLMGEGTLVVPELVMVTPSVAVARSELKTLVAKLKDSEALQALRELSLKAIKENAPQRLSTEQVTAIRQLPSSVTSGLDIEGELGRDSINTLIDRATGYIASRMPSGRSLDKLELLSMQAKAVPSVKTGSFMSEENAAPLLSSNGLQKLKAQLNRIRLRDAFNPVQTRPVMFGKSAEYIEAVVSTLTNARIVNPLEKYAAMNFANRLSAVPQLYKSDFDEAVRQGLDGFSEAITKPFADSPDDLFTDYLSALYGGYDSVTELAVLRTGPAGDLLPKQELYEALTNLKPDSILGQIQQLFKTLSNEDKLKLLSVTTQLLQGRELRYFADVPEGLPEQLRTLTPRFSKENMMVPVQAAYWQRQQYLIMEQIKQELFSGFTALSKQGSVDSNIQWANAYALRKVLAAIPDEMKRTPLGIVMDLSKDVAIREAVDAYVKKDFIAALTSQVYKTERTQLTELISDIATAIRVQGFDRLTDAQKSDALSASLRRLTSPSDEVDPLTSLTANLTEALSGENSIGEAVARMSLGETRYGLNELEVRDYAKTLLDQAKNTSGKTAYDVIANSGYFKASDLTTAFKQSSGLDQVEKALTSFDYLADTHSLGKLSDTDLTNISNSLAADTSDFLGKLEGAVNSLNSKDLMSPGLVNDLTNLYRSVASPSLPSRAWDTLTTTAPNFIKNTMLGGGILPHFVYMMQNYLTGPLILQFALKNRYSKGIVRDTTRIASDLATNVADVARFGALEFNVGNPNRVMATTPSGRVYTLLDIQRLTAANNIDSSSISAELKTNIIKDMVTYAKKNMSADDVSSVTTTLRWLAKQVGFDGLSWPNRLAQEVDKAYRTRALIDALEAGESEALAIETARKAMFDYNDLTAFEREYVASYVWFYRFFRQNTVQALTAFLDNPARVARIAKLSKVSAAKLFGEPTHPDTQKYKDNRAFIKLVDGIDKERLAIYTPALPILDATATMIDTIAMAAFIGSLGDVDKLSASSTIEAFVDRFNANPALLFAQLQMMKYLAIDVKLSDSETMTYLDPRFVAWAKATGIWDTLDTYLNIELDTQPIKGVTTFDGYYYKLDQSSKQTWQLMMELTKTVGLQRTLRDYAFVTQATDINMQPGIDITTGDTLYDVLRILGFVQIGAQPTEEQAQKSLRIQKISTLKE